MTDLEKQMAEALRRIADTRNTHFSGDAQVVARQALAQFDAQAAEQAAGGGEAVNPFNLPRFVVERDGGPELVVVGRYVVGGRDTIFLSNPAPAAPSDPQLKGAACTYPKCDGDEPAQGECCKTPARTECRHPEACKGYAYSDECSLLCGGLIPSPAPAQSPAAPVQPVGERSPSTISLEDGAQLVLDGSHWSFRRSGSHIRFLNKFESQFVRAALAARGEKRQAPAQPIGGA